MIPIRVLVVVDIILLIVFIIDWVSTVQAILKFNKKLKILSDMREDIYRLSDKVGAGVADRTLNVMDKAQLLSEFSRRERRVFKAFPSMRENRYREAFIELREKFDESQLKQRLKDS